MLVHCPACEAQLETGARFCMQCGARVDLDPDWDATVGERLDLALGPGFSVLAELGRGGFAVVYSVRDARKNQYLAVKVMRPSLLAQARMRERFRRETELVARLRHVNILPILFTGESTGLVYYAMPRVRGHPLSELIERDGALPVSQAVAIIGDLAKGLTYAHGQGIVHRDVKPANILIEEDGHLSIVDFGIAKALTAKGQSISITGEIVGSAEYMSPERAQGDPEVDHRADIYSLGIVAFEMLTGQKPFAAETVHDMLIKQVEEPAPRVRSLRPEVSPIIDAAVNQCLAKAPAKRWQSAEAAARALGASI
jgi:eukaryotic-like serine/threonine-protein kinase